MNMMLRFLLLSLMMVTQITRAEPYIPEQDQQVLERLPEPLFQSTSRAKVRVLSAQLKTHPDDWSSASQLAQHYINLAQTQADPRYMGYARAILKPWWSNSHVPIQALIMRAVIKQNAHNFKAASEDLDQVLKLQPGHIQANLIKATIATVQGDYPLAIQHCRQLLRRSSMILGLVCQSTPASLSGDAETSYKILHQILSATKATVEKQSLWAWTSLAEIAWRLGYFEAADQHFQSAVQTGAKDFYLFRVYADFLLQQQRPLDVIKLIDSETQNDSLLLRLAIAEKIMHSRHLNKHITLLQIRFKANRKRGSALHKGDEARFMLHVLNQPQSALQLARQNWQVQRESADTYILLQSAIAANNIAMLEDVRKWLNQRGTEDVVIEQILATQKGTQYEI